MIAAQFEFHAILLLHIIKFNALVCFIQAVKRVEVLLNLVGQSKCCFSRCAIVVCVESSRCIVQWHIDRRCVSQWCHFNFLGAL